MAFYYTYTIKTNRISRIHVHVRVYISLRIYKVTCFCLQGFVDIFLGIFIVNFTPLSFDVSGSDMFYICSHHDQMNEQNIAISNIFLNPMARIALAQRDK